MFRVIAFFGYFTLLLNSTLPKKGHTSVKANNITPEVVHTYTHTRKAFNVQTTLTHAEL